MTPRIETLSEKKLVGKRLTMSLANNKTPELWKSFMPRRKEIANNVTSDLIHVQLYKPSYFTNFHPTNEVEKWATVEVSDLDNIPDGMESFILSAGLYAVFDSKKDLAPIPGSFSTFTGRGYPIQNIHWMTGHILKC